MSISVHSFGLWADKSKIRELRGYLSDDEKQRADRFRFDIHRRRFTVARANLRLTLAEYTGLPAETIRFRKAEHGKPYIVSEQNPAGVSFNLSHSHELAVVIVCRENDIGIDLEYVEKNRPFMDLARRYFREEEVVHLEHQPAEAFHGEFYKIWTLKESWLKATGLGILGLSLVGTSINSSGDLVISDWGNENDQIGKVGKPYETRHFVPEPGYIAAYTRLYSSQITSTR